MRPIPKQQGDKPEMDTTINEWDVAEKAMNVPGLYVCLYGPPGTGKTYAGQHFGLPKNDNGEVNENIVLLCNITFNEGTPAAELRGHYVPMGKKFDWWDGLIAKAFRASMADPNITHVRVVVNEIDRASDELFTMMYAFADSPESARIALPNMGHEVLRPNPLKFSIVASTNLERPMQDLPEGLVDRFSFLPINTVHPGAIARLDEDLREPASKSVVAERDRRLSIRQWLVFQQCRALMAVQEAAFIAFGERWQTVLDTLAVANTPVAAYGNPSFCDQFSSWEDFEDGDDHYCGYCQTDGCTDNDAVCKPMRFADVDEYNSFCGWVGCGTAISDRTYVRDASIRYRTRSRVIEPADWPI